MNKGAPAAQAIAIRGGKIIAIGTLEEVTATAGKSATRRDLSGKTLMPGFIDAHGHFGFGSVVAGFANLRPPPAGPIRNIDDLVQSLKNWHKKNPDAPVIIGWGYDDSLLAERRHPTRKELDGISSDIPVLLFHASAHLVSCNTPCLKAAGINADTPDPAGGVIKRIPGSKEPNGLLEENAKLLAMAIIPDPSGWQFVKAVNAHQNRYASYGITTAQEGAASAKMIFGLKMLSWLGQLKLDVAAYRLITSPSEFDGNISSSDTYWGHFRLGGIKLLLDGSPQGKTAWLTQPYYVVPDGADKNYRGYPTMKTGDVNAIVHKAFARGIQLHAHTNGDAASDQMLTAIARANSALGNADRRSVMIHAQTVRDDQISAMKRENIIPSYFVSHTFYWGDWHRDSVLGPERASRISPLRTTRDMALASLSIMTRRWFLPTWRFLAGRAATAPHAAAKPLARMNGLRPCKRCGQ